MLRPGDPIPDVALVHEPGVERRLRATVAEGPLLVLFYLLDWTST